MCRAESVRIASYHGIVAAARVVTLFTGALNGPVNRDGSPGTSLNLLHLQHRLSRVPSQHRIWYLPSLVTGHGFFFICAVTMATIPPVAFGHAIGKGWFFQHMGLLSNCRLVHLGGGGALLAASIDKMWA